MHQAYFETRFRVDGSSTAWPASSAILTAWATTGEQWPREQNEDADRELLDRIKRLGVWHRRVTGYSPTTGHAEPGWAIEMPFAPACDLGVEFRQDALYFVLSDMLYVSHCDHRRSLVLIGSFLDRVDHDS